MNPRVMAAAVVVLSVGGGTGGGGGEGMARGPERLIGALDEVTVCDRPLTDAEIASLAAAPQGKRR